MNSCPGLITNQNQAGAPADTSQLFRVPCMHRNSLPNIALLESPAPFLPRPRTNAKVELIPTQWPHAKFEQIPTTWPNLTLRQIVGQSPGFTPTK
jgi:hypothetical protein